MPVHVSRGSAVVGALALTFAVAACSPPPSSPHAGPDPADAAAPVRPVTDVSTIGGYVSYRPVSPRPWREQNERVAPGARR